MKIIPRSNRAILPGDRGPYCEKCGSSLKWSRLFWIFRRRPLGCIMVICERYYRRDEARTPFEAIMETHVNRAGALKLFRALGEGCELDIDGERFWVSEEPKSFLASPEGHLVDWITLENPEGKTLSVSFDDLVVHLSK